MSKKIKIILTVGARPNFMKIVPLLHEMKKHPEFAPVLVHTGQHYDTNMSALFLEQFDIPEPDINLEVGSASHAVQTARIMERFEKVCIEENPQAVLVVGDVNSTAACTLAAAKLNIKTIHYEAGLRSGDKSMPEEINRLVTDAICDFFFTTLQDANENLIKEGHSENKIFMCGNLMIDSLLQNLKKSNDIDMQFKTLSGRTIRLKEDFVPGEYGVMTFHHPVNVDKKESLEELVDIWVKVSKKIPLVFPVHPRTRKNLRAFGFEDHIRSSARLFLIDSVGYLQFINLMKQAKFVLTDSGGIQEETTYLNIPCLTIRPCTERPVTIWQGSNKLIKVHEIMTEVQLILMSKGKTGEVPRFWDGQSAERIVKVLSEILKR
ncbi:MAG: UDP-N-acetylglucosamine 2-epimerase (non-hydrolyzing) [Candidatus Aminicenantes bacterium]|nr:UDP-N-acetylglucosamine 2-epimerase (non-hydrolyzing) [Candidatus Aminicenantes bacterium]